MALWKDQLKTTPASTAPESLNPARFDLLAELRPDVAVPAANTVRVAALARDKAKSESKARSKAPVTCASPDDSRAMSMSAVT